jgi:multimeric flavodoxin WrbA
MSTTRKMLLLVGSPKRGKSTSESIGTYLLERVKEKGIETDKIIMKA